MIEQNFRQIWDQLRGKKPRLDFFLEETRIRGLRGISDLSVRLSYPVSVLAGPNACGKTTVLFAFACAYRVPQSGIKDFVPSTMFPDFKTRQSEHPSDHPIQTSLEYYYVDSGERNQMRWARTKKGWNRSFLGLKRGRQPERPVYLRTLTNLSNPSEVRSGLKLGSRQDLEQEEITADLLVFAQRVLPLRYKKITSLRSRGKDVLFAEREDGNNPTYSEFHMSAGERAILRLSREISRMSDGLILIDEIEAGLHPFTQQQLMLELQRLALRNDLQIVVTTHSPVILDAVPTEGRIFLERSIDNVTVSPPYRDVIQKAFYGRALDKLYVLCEDELAEALLRGVFDVLNPRLSLSSADVEVGRDTGKEEFPQHVRALAKFNQLDEFVFVLDGDARQLEVAVRNAASEYGKPIRLLFLPGLLRPESWVWDCLSRRAEEYAELLGQAPATLREMQRRIAQIFDGAADTPRNIARGRLAVLADDLARTQKELCRIVGRREAERDDSEMQGFLQELERTIESWRNERGLTS